MKFDEHVSNICIKAGRKLSALTRMTKILSFEKRRILMKAFVESQFKYCPLTWMFHSRKCNNKINNLHERALRIVYDDYTSSLNELLDRDGSFSVHHNSIQTLAIEIYKVMHNLSKGIILNEIFTARNYNGPCLRTQSKLQQPHVNSVNNGENSLRFFCPIVWNILPTSIKNVDSLHNFKRLVKKWKPTNCPCRLCRVYISRIGFVNIVE